MTTYVATTTFRQFTADEATEIIDSIREHTYSPYHNGGWTFDMDRDAAIKFLIAASDRKNMAEPA